MALENLTPMTRLESYLAKIRGDEVDTPETKTRLESYLNKIAGIESEQIPVPRSRLEFYLAAIAGADIEVPAPRTRLEEYLYKMIDEAADAPIPIERIEHFIANLAGMEVEVPEVKTRLEYWLTRGGKPVPPHLKYALKFSSPNPFTLTTADEKCIWSPKYDASEYGMEYCVDGATYNEWEVDEEQGINKLTAGLVDDEYVIYLRGTNLSSVGGYSTTRDIRFLFEGSNIACNGNIENLLDYNTVKTDGHLEQSGSFISLFKETPIITPPELPSTNLSQTCYRQMFSGCRSLTTAPLLPATTLTDQCYFRMFAQCSALTVLPVLPATVLKSTCYAEMFSGCTQIKLSETQTDEYQTEYRIPTSGTGTTASSALGEMFSNTGGTFTGAPEINTIYYTSNTVVS